MLSCCWTSAELNIQSSSINDQIILTFVWSRRSSWFVILSTAPRCQDRDGVRIFKILFTFIYITNHNENRITTKSISNSNCLIRPLPLTATTRLPASTVSQPAVTPTTCHVTCRPPYMARKRSTVTKYGVQSSRRSITWHHVTSRAQMQSSVMPMSVLCMHAASHGSSLTHIRDKNLLAKVTSTINIAVSLHWSNEVQSTITRLQVVLLITRAIKE